MTEQVEKTEELNTKNRIKKTERILYGHLRNILWNNQNKQEVPNLEVRKKMYESLVRPSLQSGLNVFKLSEKEKKELVDMEKTIFRTMLMLRKRAPMNIIYKMTGQLPMRAHLDKGILSILYNIWYNKTNPIYKLTVDSVGKKGNKGTWLEEAE